jgi:hypothetical protein
MIRTRRIRWVGQVAHWGEEKCNQEFGRKMAGNKLEDRSIDGWIILKYILIILEGSRLD